jgi:LPS-assembly protein
LLVLALVAGAASTRAQDASSPPADEEESQQKAGDASATEEAPSGAEKGDVTAAPAGAGTDAVKAAPGGAKARPGKPAPKPRDPDLPSPGTVRIRADFQEVLEKGHYQARGSVDLRTPEARVETDLLDIYEIDKPDGTKGKKLIATGNVVFIQGDERLAGDRATLDIDTGTGIFENARGFVQTGMLVEGRTIERIDAGTYRIEGGRFTACTQPNPRWNFTASSATVHPGDKIVAENVLFRVRGVPTLYFPIFVYPIKDDQRATGFLFPRLGNSTVRGFTTGAAFFWAMGRSVDQTFYADRYSRSGYGIGHELRWALDSPSRGSLRTFAYSPSALTEDKWDYDINWSAQQQLPDKSRVTLDVRRYSSTFFQNQVQDNFNLATSRFQTEQVGYQKKMPFATLSLLADDRRVFFSDQTRILRHLPSLLLRRTPKRIAKSPVVFGFDARAEGLGVGNEEAVHSYSRLDVFPQVSLPLSTTFLSVTPKVAYRYTRYGNTLDLDTTTQPTGPSLTRRYFEASVELTGPTFAHVFSNPGGVYSDRFKHVIGPEAVWTFRTAVDDFNLIPKFDGVDQQLGTSQIYYGLAQKVFAKRPGPNGKSIPFELFSWRLGQTYYVTINEGQNEFDSNYSTGVYGPGGLPDHNSPIQSRMSLSPAAGLSADFDVEYDVNFKQVRNLSIGGRVGGSRASVSGTWNTATRVSEDPADRTTIRDFVRGALNLQPLRQLTLEGTANYDFVNKEMLQSTARLRWGVQCCGFNLEMIQYHLNTRNERIVRFSLDLANVGSMGSFGQDDNVRGPGR